MNGGYPNLSIREINETLIKLQNALESDKELNRIDFHRDIKDIRTSFRQRIIELSELLTGDRVCLPKPSELKK